MTISISRLVISVFLVTVVSLAVPLFAQQTEQTTKPATVSTADLRPGMWCRVTLETPLYEDACSLLGYSGIIQEVTKDEIVLVTTCDFRNERRVPILAALPYLGKYFYSTSIGRDVVTRRIPLAKIAAIECRGGNNVDGDADSPERIGVDFK
ncbi:MAG: hypothetical protein ACYC4U_16015 [Pirellulaceae bacterium]